MSETTTRYPLLSRLSKEKTAILEGKVKEEYPDSYRIFVKYLKMHSFIDELVYGTVRSMQGHFHAEDEDPRDWFSLINFEDEK